MQQTVSGKLKWIQSTQVISLIANLVKIFVLSSNPQVTKSLSTKVGTSENIRLLSFNQWLAGLIDADGYFGLSQKGYGSLEITMDIRDAKCLYKIKNMYGGSIKRRSGVHALRYRLHAKDPLLNLLNNINGELKNPVRILQFEKLCSHYKVITKLPSPIIYNSNWVSGFFDGDGTVTLNNVNNQLTISFSQKNSLLLDDISKIHGGNVYPDRASNTFKLCISKKEEVNNFLKYVKEYPCYSLKINRLHLIPQFYYIKSINKDNPALIKLLENFHNKWNRYEG